MSDIDSKPLEMKEPESFEGPGNIWARGLWMIILALMFAVAETILGVTALIQWFWMVFTKKRNSFLSDFGKDLGGWMNDVARFQTGVTEEKPFPWKPWGA